METSHRFIENSFNMITLRKELNPDFIIVGAGPAGLIGGIGLLRRGFSVQILERLPQQLRTVCGEYLSPEGKEKLEILKLGDVLEGFQSVTGMVLFSPGGRRVETQFPEGRTGTSVNRQIFQQRLEKHFLNQGGIIHYNAQIDEIKTFSDHFEVKTGKGNFISNYLLGSDGRQSTMARLLGMKTLPPQHKRVALHCFLRPLSPLAPFGQMHIFPDGSYIGINPINANEVNFSLVTEQEAIKKAGGVRGLLNSWISERTALKEQFPLITSEAIKTTSPITRRAVEIVKGRAALIGDASGFIDPLTGEGMTTAIKTTELLLNEIDCNNNIEEAFRNYAHRRKNDFLEKEKLNIRFQSLIKSSFACESVAMFLNSSKRIRDTFIGVVGNVYSPRQGLTKILLGFLTERF